MTDIREGTLHRKFEIEGVLFEIYYGYSNEQERKRGWEPSPLYPDFNEKPQYTPSGYQFTVVYGVCDRYIPTKESSSEWCENCEHFEKHEQYVGICRCEQRRKATVRSGTPADG